MGKYIAVLCGAILGAIIGASGATEKIESDCRNSGKSITSGYVITCSVTETDAMTLKSFGPNDH